MSMQNPEPDTKKRSEYFDAETVDTGMFFYFSIDIIVD